MRFARLQAVGSFHPAGLADIAAGGRLGLIQLDFLRPRPMPVADPHLGSGPEFAGGFREALLQLRTALYLDPALRVATSAGWCDAYGCVEDAAGVLVEGGCGNVVVSAVRGSNLLPILDVLHNAGVKLENAATGRPWRDLPGPVLAADLQLGAGPFVTAFIEGARVVVSGHYDATAPAIAASMHQFPWTWSDFHKLAAAAVAARAAVWPQWAALPLLAQDAARGPSWTPRVEIEEQGVFCVERNVPFVAGDADELRQWLVELSEVSAEAGHADIHPVTGRIAVDATSASQLRVAGVAGTKSDAAWRLDVLYQAGYFAEILVEFTVGIAAGIRTRIIDALRSYFADPDQSQTKLVMAEIGAAGDGASWLHAVFRSPTPKPCDEFIQHFVAFVGANSTLIRLAGSRPRVQIECELWPTSVPRDAVDVAVDTRPAHEWQ